MPRTKSELSLEIMSSVHAISWARKREARATHGDSVNLLATLQAVNARGEARPSALADDLMTELSTISRRLSTLEGQELIERVPDPSDRRAQLITLAPAGSALLERLRQSWGAELAAGLGAWTVHDLQTLSELLHRLEADLNPDGARARQSSLSASTTPQAPTT
jgi:DNA-binding MarR family transcriptional regulator